MRKNHKRPTSQVHNKIESRSVCHLSDLEVVPKRGWELVGAGRPNQGLNLFDWPRFGFRQSGQLFCTKKISIKQHLSTIWSEFLAIQNGTKSAFLRTDQKESSHFAFFQTLFFKTINITKANVEHSLYAVHHAGKGAAKIHYFLKSSLSGTVEFPFGFGASLVGTTRQNCPWFCGSFRFLCTDPRDKKEPLPPPKKYVVTQLLKTLLCFKVCAWHWVRLSKQVKKGGHENWCRCHTKVSRAHNTPFFFVFWSFGLSPL